MFTKFRPFLILLVVMISTSLACNLTPSLSTRATNTPRPANTPTLVVSTQSVGDLEKKVDSAYKDLQAGKPATITVTEAELTSLIAVSMSKLPQQDVVITSPEIRLHNNQIVLRGQMKQGNFNTEAELIFNPFVNSTGDLQVQLISGKLGPLPIPAPLLTTISQVANEALVNAITINNKPLKLQTVSVTEGKLTISGVLQ